MASWMRTLSNYYNYMRKAYPDERLLILFDLDGTIVDTRYMIHNSLKSFDQRHGTTCFSNLKVTDINSHEKHIDQWLEKYEKSKLKRHDVIEWCKMYYWSSPSMTASHRPFAGVLDVIRWFQIQPKTYVGLNTGRNESVRLETLRTLNHLGREYGVTFSNRLLYMNSYPSDEKIISAKMEGISHFQQNGYRIFAFVDNEPENLLAAAAKDQNQEILLLHADTIFSSKRKHLPAGSISGSDYDFTELTCQNALAG